MDKAKKILLLVAWLVPIALTGASAPAADLTGTWTGTWDIPHSGIDELTLILKKTGTTYTGTINDSLGFIVKDTPIAEVVVDGHTISFSLVLSLEEEADLGLKLELREDKLSGEILFKAKGASVPFEMTKK